MNWAIFAKYALQALTLIPPVVHGIEKMCSDSKQGATKKELAMSALGLSYGVASTVIPEHQDAINAATQFASTAIDNYVTLQNAIQHPDFTKATPATSTATSCVPVAKVADAPQPAEGPGLETAVPA